MIHSLDKKAARRLRTVYFILPALLFLISFTSLAQKAVPELWGTHVHDDAHVLKQETIDQLEQQLKRYEDSTSNQIAVLTITSLESEDLEGYSMRVAEAWKLGSAKNDNGVLLLVAVDDHKMRIEVGQGLEGVLTDAQSSRIIRNEMAPAFRRNDYDTGIQAGVDGIILVIGGEYAEDSGSNDFEGLSLKERIVTGLFLFGILGIFTLIGLFSKGAMGWVLYFFLMFFYFAFFMVVGGAKPVFYSYVVGYPLLKLYLNRHPKWKNKMMKWTAGSGGWGGGSGGWSSGGGGGFSGGGGSFGGGGGSGSW